MKVKLLPGISPDNNRYETWFFLLLYDLEDNYIDELKVIQAQTFNVDENGFEIRWLTGTYYLGDKQKNFYGNPFLYIQNFLKECGYIWDQEDIRQRFEKPLS